MRQNIKERYIWEIKIHLGKCSTMRHLAYERVKGRIGNNEGSHRMPVVLQEVRIVGLMVLKVVQADPKVGLVLVEMVHMVSIVGLMV